MKLWNFVPSPLFTHQDDKEAQPHIDDMDRRRFKRMERHGADGKARCRVTGLKSERIKRRN